MKDIKNYSTLKEKVELLEQTQQFAEELEVSNEELQATTEELQVANEKLRQQGEELIHINRDLQKSEEKFRALINNSTDLIRILDEKGLIIFDSPSSTRILGYPEGFFIGKSPLDFIHPEDLLKVSNDLKKVYEKENPGIPTEFRIKRINGSYIPVESVAQNLMDVPGINGVIVTTHPLTERKKIENALKEMEEKFRVVFDSVDDQIFMKDRDLRYLLVNPALERFFGITKDKIIDKTDDEIFSRENVEHIQNIDDRVLKGEVIKEETPPIGPENNVFHVIKSPMYDNDGTIIGLCGIARDITEKKHSHEEIKKSLKEKEVLLQEIHHRVKNNMQIISSLLNLQKHYLDDDIAINVIKECQNRVKSMAFIHEKLYQSHNLAGINFYDYTQSQISDLFYSYAVDKSKITSVIEMEEITLNIETALPIGLIINELISNSLKYAFPGDRKGEIFIGVKSSDDGEFELRVRDNGIGFPEGMELNNIDSLGLELVTNLINQIDGEMELDSVNGVDFKIKFRELKYEKRI